MLYAMVGSDGKAAKLTFPCSFLKILTFSGQIFSVFSLIKENKQIWIQIHIVLVSAVPFHKFHLRGLFRPPSSRWLCVACGLLARTCDTGLRKSFNGKRKSHLSFRRVSAVCQTVSGPGCPFCKGMHFALFLLLRYLQQPAQCSALWTCRDIYWVNGGRHGVLVNVTPAKRWHVQFRIMG